MEHSKNYEKVLNWYLIGVWDANRVGMAVVKGWITENEYQEITGNLYVAG